MSRFNLVRAFVFGVCTAVAGVASAASDRMGGAVWNSTSAGVQLQLGIMSSYDNDHKGFLDKISSEVSGALTGSSLSQLFNVSQPAVAGYHTCDGFYNSYRGTIPGTSSLFMNNAVIMFNGMPTAPAADTFTNPDSLTAWASSAAATYIKVTQNENPCNWIGNGQIFMTIRIPASMSVSVLQAIARATANGTLGTSPARAPDITTANYIASLIPPSNLISAYYTIIAFKLATVKLPW